MKAHEQLQIDRGPNGLEITYRWRSRAVYFLLFFALVWNGAILFFLLSGAGWAVIFHLLVGLGLAWYVLSRLLNRTRIRVGSGRLTVDHGPIPSFHRSAEVSARSVTQLRTVRGGSYKPKNGKRVQLYRLALETDDGREVNLVRGQRDRELLLGLERTIEEHLGITDEPVAESDPAEEFNLDLAEWNEMKERVPAFLRKPIDGMAERARTQVPGSGGPAKPEPNETAPPPHLPPSESEREDRRPADLREGDRFRLRNAIYRVVRIRNFDWTDPRHRQSRIIRAIATEGTDERQFYLRGDGTDWTYYEERLLDPDERDVLGFAPGGAPPLSLRNGDDRYYGGEPLELADGGGREYMYYTTRSSTQFRALRRSGGNWEVAVQEPVDGSVFVL